MNILDSLILGVVEGFSEFLPISSTGHLIIASHLLKLDQTDFLKSFEIAIQLGAILSVAVIYWKTILVRWSVLKRVLAAFFPTAVIGFVLYKLIKKFLLGNMTVVLTAMAVGGLILIVFEKMNRKKDSEGIGIDELSLGKAAWIGVFQSLAIIPGVSRSAATIVGGLMLGVERKAIVEFSFLLALPTMLAATALDLLKNADSFSSDQFSLLSVGFAASFVTAFFCIKGFLKYIQRHTFVAFGIYRIATAVLLFFLFR